ADALLTEEVDQASQHDQDRHHQSNGQHPDRKVGPLHRRGLPIDDIGDPSPHETRYGDGDQHGVNRMPGYAGGRAGIIGHEAILIDRSPVFSQYGREGARFRLA
ncbi:hypothetical protein CPI28_02630, partial [Moraxella catarrhalis]|nr:hypothetical protein [Moraxella catarrhalis]